MNRFQRILRELSCIAPANAWEAVCYGGIMSPVVYGLIELLAWLLAA
jgi:hypothetical protein